MCYTRHMPDSLYTRKNVSKRNASLQNESSTWAGAHFGCLDSVSYHFIVSTCKLRTFTPLNQQSSKITQRGQHKSTGLQRSWQELSNRLATSPLHHQQYHNKTNVQACLPESTSPQPLFLIPSHSPATVKNRGITKQIGTSSQGAGPQTLAALSLCPSPTFSCDASPSRENAQSSVFPFPSAL